MTLKKALFTIAFISITAAFFLSLFLIWLCVVLRSQIAPIRIPMDMNDPDSIVIAGVSDPDARTLIIAEIISAAQIILPALIYVIALFVTATAFYRLKLKEPLNVLAKGAARIIDNDLDFMIEAKSQDELGQLCTAFETMRKTLLENNRELWRQAEERKRLNAAFSHNLRNPVTVLMGSVKLARSSIGNEAIQREEIADDLLRMERYTGRIEQYIETMSSVQKLEDITVRKECVKWDSLTAELLHLTNLMALDHQKQITFTAKKDSRQVLIDKSILFQITENLVSNALRFAEDRIDIRCLTEDGRLFLSVTDNGCGFPEKLMKGGIQPFQKGTEEIGHFGMGLYTCELLCKKHGGDITIENRPAGAEVSVFLTIG